MTNTELFAKYLQENGLTHANHQRILEVLNAPSNSISRYIDKNSFLLNNLVTEGFCSDIDNPNLNLRLSRAKSLVESYNEKSQGTYELQRDKDKNKVYCLVRRVK